MSYSEYIIKMIVCLLFIVYTILTRFSVKYSDVQNSFIMGFFFEHDN